MIMLARVYGILKLGKSRDQNFAPSSVGLLTKNLLMKNIDYKETQTFN